MMILSLFLTVLVVLLMAFCSYKKKLHLFEIFFIWMTVWLLTHSVSSILIINLKVIELSQQKSDFWTHFFKRLLLYPLIVTIFFDLYLRGKTRFFRILTICINIFVMVIMEYFPFRKRLM